MVCTLVEILLDLTRIERQHRIVGTRCYTAYTQFWPCGSLKLNLVMSTSEQTRERIRDLHRNRAIRGKIWPVLKVSDCGDSN